MELNEYQQRVTAGFHSLDERPCPACADLDGCHLPAKIRAGTATLEQFWRAHSLWSQATFGTDRERGPKGPVEHLCKESCEAHRAITHGGDLLEELADCLFLVFDAARRGGWSYDQLVEAVWKKLGVNQRRQWQKRTTDGPVEHVR